VHAQYLAGAIGSLVSALTRSRVATWAGFSQLRADGPVAHALRAHVDERELTVLREVAYERAALLPRSSSDVAQVLSTKHRSELRRKLRRLGEEVGAEPEIACRAGDPDAVTRLLALEHRGWKLERGTSLLACDASSALFREVCRGFAERCRLELLELSAGGRPLALTSALRAGDGVFGFKAGHDPDVERWSPGVQVQVALAERVLAEGPATWVDSCSDPRNETQNRLWPDRRRIVHVLLPTRSQLAPLVRVLRG
jgi:CelD/BcsL family acetyltransferase involved in cellulose biosynthesis